MAMTSHHQPTEIAVLQAIVAPADETKRIARLVVLRPEWFAPAQRPAIDRLLSIYRIHGRVADAQTMWHDAALPEDSRTPWATMLVRPDYRAPDDASYDALVSNLHKHYRTAMIAAVYQDMSDFLGKNQGQMDEIAHAQEATSRLMAAIAETDPMPPPVVVGQRDQSGASLAHDILAGAKPSGTTYRTGFPEADMAMAGGLMRGEVLLLASGSGCGKSILGMTLADHLAYAGGANVLYCCGEMGQETLLMRHMSMRMGLDHSRLRRHRYTEHCIPETEYAPLMARYRAECLDSQRGSLRFLQWGDDGIDDVLAQGTLHGVDVLVVDYIQFLTETPKNREESWRVWSRVVKQAKLWAIKRNAIVILLSQVNADGQLSESKAMSHHVDHYWYWEVDKLIPTVEVEVRKIRGGAHFRLYLERHWHHMRFVATEACTHEANLQKRQDEAAGPKSSGYGVSVRKGGGR